MKLIFLSIILLILACNKSDRIVPEHQVIAKVNKDIFSEDEIKSFMVDPAEKNNDHTRKIVQNWIEKSILYQEAIKLNYSLDESDLFRLKQIEKDMIINKYLKSKYTEVVITDKELNDYYILNNAEFKRLDDETHLIHLFLDQRNPSIQTEIFKTKDLLAVVNQYRLNKTINQNLLNGDLGFIKDEDLPSSFKARILKAKLNEIIGPVRMNSGYHYFQVLDRKKEGTFIPFDQVKDIIRQRLYLEKIQAVKLKTIESNKEKYIIENKYR